MMIVMKPTATEEDVQSVIARIESCGAKAHPSRGEEVTVIGAVGDREHVARPALAAPPRAGRPRQWGAAAGRRGGRTPKPQKPPPAEGGEPTVIVVAGRLIGGEHFSLIA